MINSADLDAMGIKQQTNVFTSVLFVECNYVRENNVAFIRIV